jgi:DNA invertase Pin-like site-specific DNA recombinase
MQKLSENSQLATTQDLLRFVQAMNPKEVAEIDTSKFRYVIYVRKSTEDEDKQIRSIQDQIKECSEIAKSRNLNVVKIIPETKSAKELGARPKFAAMIEDIKAGKYDGIISWHPDRLSRNMWESGMIIDLLDKFIIKDLQFYSVHFENSATGKMLLGITFVLSKHYSDNLSDNVSRGNRRSVDEGKYLSKYKRGYYKDTNQLLRPDVEPTNYFRMIQQAWEMKLKGEALETIADYLNKSEYRQAFGIGGTEHRDCIMTKQKLSQMFQDSFYAGVLNFGSEYPVDLTEKYDFQPMITPNDYISVIGEKQWKKVKGIKKGEVKSDLLRDVVFCNTCKKDLQTSITSKQLKNRKAYYFYYKCTNFGCKFVGKSVRGTIVTDFVIKFLEDHQLLNENSYQDYKVQAERLYKEQAKELTSEKYSLTQKIRYTQQKIELTKKLLMQDIDNNTRKTFEADLKSLQEEIKIAEERIAELNSKIADKKESILEESKFIELFDSLPQILRNNREIEPLDFIIRKIFSNFYISMEEGTGNKAKIVSFKLKRPFDILLKDQKVLSGGRRGTRTPMDFTPHAPKACVSTNSTIRPNSKIVPVIVQNVQTKSSLDHEIFPKSSGLYLLHSVPGLLR